VIPVEKTAVRPLHCHLIIWHISRMLYYVERIVIFSMIRRTVKEVRKHICMRACFDNVVLSEMNISSHLNEN
jgi:hypothetical protein